MDGRKNGYDPAQWWWHGEKCAIIFVCVSVFVPSIRVCLSCVLTIQPAHVLTIQPTPPGSHRSEGVNKHSRDCSSFFLFIFYPSFSVRCPPWFLWREKARPSLPLVNSEIQVCLLYYSHYCRLCEVCLLFYSHQAMRCYVRSADI